MQMDNVSESLATRLSGDAIAEVVKWLPSDALGALVLCGDAQLNRHLTHHIRSLTHCNTRNHFTWPFYMRDWKTLTHLNVTLGTSSEDMQTMDMGTILALAARVAKSLPNSLVSFHVDGSPQLFQAVLYILSQNRKYERPILSHSSLPHLSSFTFTRIEKTPSTAETSWLQYNSLANWIGCVKEWSSSLTHLSLSNLILSSLNLPLCNILSRLPRTITNLRLRVDNSENQTLFYRHSTSTTSAYNNDALFANVLPPHLTRLKLDLTTASHMPPTILSRLANLTTLSLSVGDHLASSNDTCPTNILSHLPASVTKLSLNGFLGTDLQLYMDSIPDDHCNLRQLTIKNVAIAPGLRLLHPTNLFAAIRAGRIDMYNFLRTIASYPKFKRLEAFHVTSDDGAILDDHYDTLSAMTRLRSVSGFFLRPCFDAFWKCIAAFTTIDAPMTVRCGKEWDEEYGAVAFNNQWLQNTYFQKAPTQMLPLHLAIDHLVLCESLCRFLVPYRGDDAPSAPPTAHATALMSTLKTVKHLTMSSNDDGIDVLKAWPGRLESLKIVRCSPTIPIESIFSHSIANCVRALRVLIINTQLDTTHLSSWLRLLPETLETLHIWRVRIIANDVESTDHVGRALQLPRQAATHISPKQHILTYMPPRLQTMWIRDGFAIGKETFDAMPSSLRNVEWLDVLAILCDTSELCRWPKRMRSIYVGVSLGVRMSSEYNHCVDTLKQWMTQSSYLETVRMFYTKSNGELVSLEYSDNKFH